MALTPDTENEAFLREVDDNLRRDNMEDFAKRYGKWIAGAVILFLAAVGGYLYWQNRQAEESAERSEELMAIYNDIGAGKAEDAQKRLQSLQESGDGIVRALALLADAAIALDSNDRAEAVAKYRAVADDGDLPDAYRNLALIRATAIEFDTIKPEEVIARLEPLTTPGSAFFGSAGELTAMAYLKQGQKEQAGRLFAAIAGDKSAPLTLRSRAVQIAGTLRVDASAALPQPGQPGNVQ